MRFRRCIRRGFVGVVVSVAISLNASTFAGVQAHAANLGAIDVHRMNPQTYFMDEYSFLTQPHSFYYRHNMHRLDLHLDWIKAGNKPVSFDETRLNQSPTLNFETCYTFRGRQYTLREYFERTDALGLLVLKSERMVFEKYFHGTNLNSRFDTCSIEKSFVSSLIGIALQEGRISNIHDSVTKYLPYLSKSAYDGTTVKDLLQMTACVDWEIADAEGISSLEYRDMCVFFPALLDGRRSFRDLAKSTIRGPLQAGKQFAYQNMNTNTLGLILEEVYDLPLNQIVSIKLWKPGGMEADSFVWRGKKQANFQACGGLNATLRDYARYGRMIANNGVVNGRQVIPETWIKGLFKPDHDFLKPKPPGPNDQACVNKGYNHQWHIAYGTGNNHALFALGAFGQMIYIDSQHDFVVVQTSAQKEGADFDLWDEMLTVFAALAQID